MRNRHGTCEQRNPRTCPTSDIRHHPAGSRRKAASPVLSIVGLAALLLAPATAWAQNCGDWSRPVVCRAELIAIDEDHRNDRLNDRTRIELAPRQRLELEVDARDQYGRQFPPENMALGFDDYRCRSILNVEDRGEGRLRVEATAAEGRCTLDIWMPNNLNFRWQLDVEISAGARSSYERAEAEIVANALYAAILDRQADAGGFSGAVAEIQSGNLDAQIDAMTRSSEFQQVLAGMAAEQVLEQFYRGILDRQADSAGVRLYLSEIQRRQYASVLRKLILSPEFERRLQR